MSPHDASLYYDGHIPAHMIDPAAVDRLRTRPHAAIGKVTVKPEIIRRKMAAAMTLLATGDCITEGDLIRLGFSKADIAAHFNDALRQVLVENPTFTSLQRSA